MEILGTNAGVGSTANRKDRYGDTRVAVLVLGCFLLGTAVSAFWFMQRIKSKGDAGTGGTAGLTEKTRSTLHQLNSAVELRFYSVLDPASVPESVRAFSSRVSDLVSRYEAQANGKLKVTRFTTLSTAVANSAAADGITGFNRDKGDVCYLGIAVAQKNQKESLAQLSPDWEQALEPDLTRAIIRVSTASEVTPVASASPPDPAVVQEVSRAVTNVASVSLQDGNRVLREAALEQFKAAVKEMESKIKEAQQKLADAQSTGSAADQQIALKQLQQVQAEQTEKLKQIAARSKAQVDALQQIKAAR